VYLKLVLTGSPVEELRGVKVLVWTTTPWTLFANVALAVGSGITYVRVRNTRQVGESTVSEELLLAESRLAILEGDVEILSSHKGAEIVGSTYEQIFADVALDAEQHPQVLTILPGDFVSTDDGSGIVHLAPAFGQDDFEMSKVFNLPVPQPVTPNGHFSSEIKDFAGRAVKSFTYSDHSEEGADRDIVKALKIAGKIYKASFDYLHSYPHCWRTDNPVIYYARDSWFIRSPRYRERLVELTRLVHWHPEEIGEGRFGNWLEEVKEWSISRDRYWGSPLPIWISEDGDSMFAVGSIDELNRKRLSFADATRVSDKVLAMFDAGEFDVCAFYYARFKSAISQIPTRLQLVPFVPSEAPANDTGASYEYEPEEGEILEALLPRNLAVQVYGGLLENGASEQGARMSAMDSATRNAGDMIKKLTLNYNRSRQASITKELIEIISGAEAV
jgi:isoleucyl-tRNA synthetase